MASWQGKHVRLVGLSSAALNGAIGVAGQLDADSGRVCVRLTAPSEAVKAHPAGVKIKPANLQGIKAAKPAPAAKPPKRSSGAAAAAAISAPAAAAAAAISAPVGDATAAGEWWTGMTHDAVYKWFTDAFMLRVEDEYTSGGSTYGAYADAFGMEPTRGAASCAGRDLGDFVEAAARAGLLPPWWDMHDFLDYASRCVGLAVEASDLRERHGSFGVAALRSLAVRITGGKPGTDVGLGGPAFGEDEEDWDWDEDEFDEWNADEEGGAEEDEDFDAQWDKGDDVDDNGETPAIREERLLERWAGLGAQTAEQAGAFKAACAAAQRTPARIIMLSGLDYIYSDDEAQALAFNAACDELKLQCLLQATAPPGKPDLIEACTQTVLAALPRAACLLVLQAEAAGAGRVLPQLRGALRAWVHAGGVLAMNGGDEVSRQDALTLLRALFPDETAGWAIINYRHPSLPEDDDQATLNERCHVLQTQSPPALPPRISADAPWLAGVPLAQRLYTYKHADADEEGCTVAVADHGDGRIIYFGDYPGAHPSIVRAIIALATHCSTPSSAAA